MVSRLDKQFINTFEQNGISRITFNLVDQHRRKIVHGKNGQLEIVMPLVEVALELIRERRKLLNEAEDIAMKLILEMSHATLKPAHVRILSY